MLKHQSTIYNRSADELAITRYIPKIEPVSLRHTKNLTSLLTLLSNQNTNYSLIRQINQELQAFVVKINHLVKQNKNLDENGHGHKR